MNKIQLILFIFLTYFLSAYGEDRFWFAPDADTVFIDLSADNYPIESEKLPQYTTSLKLGEISSDNEIHVDLLYPEWTVIKGKEVNKLKKVTEQLNDKIMIQSHLGFSRRLGYLDISFCPIIKKGKDLLRLTSCKLHISSTPSPTKLLSRSNLSSPSKRWKTQSVLHEGKWAKIKVKEEGIYTLTPAFLAKMGFKDPARVKVFGYGGRILNENWKFEQKGQAIDDLEEIPLFRKDDGSALFFAEGTVRWTYQQNLRRWIHENNPYSKYSYYFVTEGESPAQITTLKANDNPIQTVDNILYYSVYDKDAFGWYSGGREMYDEYNFAFGTQHHYPVATPSYETSSKHQEVADISFSASSTVSSTLVSIGLNDRKIGNLSIPKFGNFQSGYEVRRSFVLSNISEDNKFDFSVSPNNPARLNFIRVNYTRKLKATDAPFSFTPNTTGAVTLQIDDANSNTRLWQLGEYNSPLYEVESQLSDKILSANIDDGTKRFVIVDISASYPSPEWDETVENQDLHGDHNAYDMVILIPEICSWKEEAERLAQLHREEQGLRVKVVNAGQIYNEFSSGTPDATAYRRYMKMLYDRAKSTEDLPRYLVLFGNCAWDNRMLTSEFNGNSQKNYLLSFEVTDGFNNPNNTIFALGEQNSYVTDDYFGWLDDNEGTNYTNNKLDLSIGRLPCNNVNTAKIFVDKSTNYLKNKEVGNWKNTIYVLADHGNANLHMNDAETVVKQIEASTNRSSVIKKVYNDAYTRVSTGAGHTFPTVTRILQEAMQRGALIFNYTGHGNPDQLSHAKILQTPDFEKPNGGLLPLWIMASCEISPYDSKRHDIGRAALENPDGGAIAVMCASRAVYSNYNRILNIAYNKYLFANDDMGKRNSMGDAMRLTKVELVTPSENGGIKDGSINKLKYLLLGDPALPLKAPLGDVVLDSINGKPLTKDEIKQLKAGELVRFSGHLTDENGQILNDFTGEITATMADRLEKIVCKDNDGTADEPMVFEDRTKNIFEGKNAVVNGNFSISFRIPKDISYSTDTGRITFYAVNNDHTIECHGANEQFFLNGTDNSFAADTLAPEVFIYLNTPYFPDGGITGQQPIFGAKIKDDAGINATGIGIGHDMELVVDKDYSSPIQLNKYFNYTFGSYREGDVLYPMEELSYGAHELSFRVWDVNGNSTTKTLKFHIQNDLQMDMKVYASENPVRTSTNFVATLSQPEEEEVEAHQVTFEVYDLTGQKIWQSPEISLSEGENYALATWNVSNNVPAGIYLYKVKIKSATHKHETKAKKIIVLAQ